MKTRWIKLTTLMVLVLTLPAAQAHEDATTPKAAKTGKAMQRPKNPLSIGAAMAPDGKLWVVGLNQDEQLFTRTSSDLGVTWEEPRILDVGSDRISADGENRPKIAFGPKGLVAISYTQPLAKPYTGAIRLLRSIDHGASFALPVTVHHDRQVITHRFDSLAFDSSGVLHTVWIDKRDQVAATRDAYSGAAIYRNESRDGGLTFGADIKVADHSCECCRIALAPTPDGKLAAMWRHVFPPNIRDHAFAVLGDSTPAIARATFDEWAVDGCPHHGSGLAAATGGGYHTVWFGDKGGKVAVRYGRLNAEGKPTGEVVELPDTKAEHADVAAVGKQVVIAWRSYDGAQMHLKAWVSNDNGTHFALRELAASNEENDHPRLLVTADGIRVLWRTTKEIHVFKPEI